MIGTLCRESVKSQKLRYMLYLASLTIYIRDAIYVHFISHILPTRVKLVVLTL